VVGDGVVKGMPASLGSWRRRWLVAVV